MNDFETESDDFSNRMGAVLADLQPDAGLEDRIIARLPKHSRIFGIKGTDRPGTRKIIKAVAATVLVGTTGVIGASFMLPSLNRARETADSVKIANLEKQLQMAQSNDVETIAKAATPPEPASRVAAAAYGFSSAAQPPTSEHVPVLASTGHVSAGDVYRDALTMNGPASNAAEFGNRLSAAAASPGGQRQLGGYGGGFGGGGGGSGRGRGSFAGTAITNGLAAKDLDESTTPANAPFHTFLAAAAAPSAPPPAPTEKAGDAPASVDLGDDVAPAMPPPPSASAQVADRKIIRTGDMEFEVESFDAANERLHKIIQQCGGFVGATESQRLPNGKVQGSVTVRVPPENLDMLVMMLRALGDLKRQQVQAQDITREYTDLQGSLKAAKAMEDRLLDMIKTSRGSVKDLLAAENELGAWREKDEQLTGQINYDNNQVALSTLTVTLTEKNISQAAEVREIETINAGLEADDVKLARDEVFKAVDAAKGRIVQANLSDREAGQYTAQIVATIPPDAAGPVIDRLSQLGRVTRMESSRQQTATGDQVAQAGLKVDRRDTVLNLSIYNSAAYAARTTDSVSLACDDVETTYHAILDYLTKADGARVINSNLARPRPDMATGQLQFEIRESSADAALALLRSSGAILQLDVTENPDSANATPSKRAFVVTLNPLASIAPQETDDLTLLPTNGDVQASYERLLAFAAQTPGVRVIDKDLEQQDGAITTALINMEVTRAKLDEANHVVAAAGAIVNRKATRAPDSQNVVDSKVLLRFSFVNVQALEPRQSLDRALAASDVPAAYQSILDAAKSAGSKILMAQLNVVAGQNTTAELRFDVPTDKQAAVESAIGKTTDAISGTVIRAPENDASTDLKVRMHLVLSRIDQLAPRRSYQLQIQTSQPQAAADAIASAAQAAGGAATQRTSDTTADGQVTSSMVVAIPLAQADSMASAAMAKGTVAQDHSSEDPQAPSGPAARANLSIEFVSGQPVVSNDDLTAALKQGLMTSFRGLMWSLEMLTIGVCLLGPWIVVAAIAWKLWRRRAAKKSA